MIRPPADCLLEVVKRLEAPGDRGKPEIGDLVEVAQRPGDGDVFRLPRDPMPRRLIIAPLTA